MAGLNFNDSIRKVPQKPLVELSGQLTMLKIEVTNMEYSGINAYPYKYLPAMYLTDGLLEKTRGGVEGIVIPKGTIVSLLTNQTSITRGIPNVNASGDIPVFMDQNTGSVVYSSVDDTYYGYHESISSLLVPCNGGAQSTLPYSALDTELAGWTKSGDSPLVLGANIPLGIVIENVYQDIRGKYLSYNTQAEVYSTVVGGNFNLPYCDVSKFTDFGSDADVATPAGSAYEALWRKWAFCYFNSSTQGRSAQLLQSDLYGKFKAQGSAVTTARTAQTVGRILFTDSRFPKDLTGTIQNYPGVNVTGVNTKGLPIDLYMFTKEAMESTGLTPTAQDILDQVQSGAFGYVRIRLG